MANGAGRKSIAPQGYNIIRDTFSALKKTVKQLQRYRDSNDDYLFVEAQSLISFIQTDPAFYRMRRDPDNVIEDILARSGLSIREIHRRARYCGIDERYPDGKYGCFFRE